MNKKWRVDSQALAACESWRGGVEPDGGAYSAASLTGIMLASGMSTAAFAKAIGRSAMTLHRWRRSVPTGRPGRQSGSVHCPSAVEWEGIKAMMAPKVS